MKVLAVDPGLTTGVVLFDPIDRLAIQVRWWEEIRGEEAFTKYAQEMYRFERVRWVVCERFIPFKDGTVRTWEPEALYIIGALRHIFGIPFVDLNQGPADAHRWGTENKVAPYRDMEPHVGKGGEGHALMALRHALLYTSKGFWLRHA